MCILVQVDQPVRMDNIHPLISPFIQVEARLASTLAISSGFSTRWWLIFFSRATRGGDSYLFASYGDCCKKCQIYIRHQSCSYKCKDNLLRSSGRSMSLCMEMKIRWSFNSSHIIFFFNLPGVAESNWIGQRRSSANSLIFGTNRRGEQYCLNLANLEHNLIESWFEETLKVEDEPNDQ